MKLPGNCIGKRLHQKLRQKILLEITKISFQLSYGVVVLQQYFIDVTIILLVLHKTGVESCQYIYS